jgi:hypothetical protein
MPLGRLGCFARVGRRLRLQTRRPAPSASSAPSMICTRRAVARLPVKRPAEASQARGGLRRPCESNRDAKDAFPGSHQRPAASICIDKPLLVHTTNQQHSSLLRACQRCPGPMSGGTQCTSAKSADAPRRVDSRFIDKPNLQPQNRTGSVHSEARRRVKGGAPRGAHSGASRFDSSFSTTSFSDGGRAARPHASSHSAPNPPSSAACAATHGFSRKY